MAVIGKYDDLEPGGKGFAISPSSAGKGKFKHLHDATRAKGERVRERIQRCLDAGLTQPQIAKALGMSVTNIQHHTRIMRDAPKKRTG